MTNMLPISDVILKKVFTRPENIEILRGFIEDIIDIPIDCLYVVHSYNLQTIKEETKIINDKSNSGERIPYTEIKVLAQTMRGQTIAVEIMIHNTEDFINYTNYKMMTFFSQKPRRGGFIFSSPLPTYYIDILNLGIPKEAMPAIKKLEFHNQEDGILLSEALGPDVPYLYYFNLDADSEDESSNITYWQKFFKGKPLPPEAPEYIKEAREITDEDNLTLDEILVLALQQHMILKRRDEIKEELKEKEEAVDEEETSESK